MNRTNALLLLISLLTATILFELGLRCWTPFPINYRSNKILDPKLGYRISPRLGDIDERGFRNKRLLTSPDIVTLGDSHTFGQNVKSEDSWPQQLGTMTGRSVYNFGVGGYGILQYSFLFQEALALRPRHIILGLYLSNDLSEVCKFMSLAYWREWASDNGFDLAACEGKTLNVPDRDKQKQARSFSLSRFFFEETAVGSYYSWFMADSFPPRKSKNGEFGDVLIIDDPLVRTVVKSRKIEKHLRNTTLQNPDIALGHKITLGFLAAAQAAARDNGISFAVLLIPSKELALHSHLRRNGYSLPADYEELVKRERELQHTLTAFLTDRDVPVVSALPLVEEAIREHGNIYPSTDDGHPLRTGYQAYASAAQELVKR